MTSWKTRLKDALGRRGFRVSRVPRAFHRHPKAELRLGLRHAASARALEVGDFFFVQIGAFDGRTNDPLWDLVRRHRWRGILVEPQREAFEALQENYRDQDQLLFRQAVIGPEDGVRQLFTLRGGRDGMGDWRKQQASLHREQLLRYRQALPEVESLIAVQEVPSLTLATLLEEAAAPQVDLLQIDAEGADYEILRSLDFAQVKPAVIHYEHHHLSPQDQEAALELLIREGYQVVPESSVDTLAVLP